MTAVVVAGLGKTFQVKQKPPGLRGSLSALIRPRWRTVKAVEDVRFALPAGEILGFIGPNGAGKSTTIKMLAGILHPTTGHAEVLGYVPWRDRRQLSYHIGSVFGQKPQLWYHLPPEDTFRLFARIYELDMRDYQRRRDELVDLFDIERLMSVPVRKLSLGQRMRCEIVASLLHRPKVLFLDEPTIGLDVVAKEKIRQAIRNMNEEDGTTVFLTSHDAGDIEKLCRRVIVINHGRIIFDDRTSVLKRQHLRRKIVDVRFAEPIQGELALAGVTVLKQGTFGAKLMFDAREREVEGVIQAIMGVAPCQDITISDPPMEEIIREIYQA
jgi:ABC-2 type transport system ATP-binding protein